MLLSFKFSSITCSSEPEKDFNLALSRVHAVAAFAQAEDADGHGGALQLDSLSCLHPSANE